MKSFTVHRKIELLLPEHLESDKGLLFVKDGFAWWAFLVSLVWFVWHRMWLCASIYLGFVIVLAGIAQVLSLPDGVMAFVTFLVNIYVGLQANDWRRSALARRGFHEVADVVSDSAEEAYLRYVGSRLETEAG